MTLTRVAVTLPLIALFLACSTGPEPGGAGGAGGTGGTAGTGGKVNDAGKTVCMGSGECGANEYCTTEDGVCNTGPGCTPERPCPPVCFGECVSRKAPAYDCNLSNVVCEMVEPQCPPGETPSAQGGCYGPCVPIERCKCSPSSPRDCPEDYVCWAFAGHCGPYVR